MNPDPQPDPVVVDGVTDTRHLSLATLAAETGQTPADLSRVLPDHGAHPRLSRCAFGSSI